MLPVAYYAKKSATKSPVNVNLCCQNASRIIQNWRHMILSDVNLTEGHFHVSFLALTKYRDPSQYNLRPLIPTIG